MTTTLSSSSSGPVVRLRGEDVERGGGDLARAERLDQRLLVDELAARGVDDPHAVAHLRDRVGAERSRASRRVSGRCRVRNSAAASTSSGVSTRSTPSSRNRSFATNGSYATTRIPSPSARRATCWPMRPKPSTPSVLPSSSTPPQRRALPAALLERRVRLRDVARRARRSRPTVCSAAEMTVDSGAFATTIPRRVAASTSTLSTPTPARPITFRRSARSISVGGQLRRRADDDRVVVADRLGEVAVRRRRRRRSARAAARSPASAIGSRTRTLTRGLVLERLERAR